MKHNIKDVKITFQYADSHNWKDEYEVTTALPSTEINNIRNNLYEPHIVMGSFGSLSESQFFGGQYHSDEFNDEYDHNLLSVIEIEEI